MSMTLARRCLLAKIETRLRALGIGSENIAPQDIERALGIVERLELWERVVATWIVGKPIAKQPEELLTLIAQNL